MRIIIIVSPGCGKGNQDRGTQHEEIPSRTPETRTFIKDRSNTVKLDSTKRNSEGLRHHPTQHRQRPIFTRGETRNHPGTGHTHHSHIHGQKYLLMS